MPDDIKLDGKLAAIVITILLAFSGWMLSLASQVTTNTAELSVLKEGFREMRTDIKTILGRVR